MQIERNAQPKIDKSSDNKPHPRSDETFEALFSHEQVKLLQKLMPSGYSIVVSSKATRVLPPLKRLIPEKPIIEEIVSHKPSQPPLPKITIPLKQPALEPIKITIPASNPARSQPVQNTSRPQTEASESRPFQEKVRPLVEELTAPKKAVVASKPDPELIKKCKPILDTLRKHQLADPFLFPVDHVALRIPDYPLIIKEPMDLSTVGKKLTTGQYSSQAAFEADIRKIWTNALTYNLPGSQIYRTTEEMSKYFERLIREENPREDKVAKLKQQIQRTAKQIAHCEGRNPVLIEPKVSEAEALSETPLTTAEKQELARMIRQLPSEYLFGIWSLLANEQAQENDELEFDIEYLPPKIARQLEVYVKSRIVYLNYRKSKQAKQIEPKPTEDSKPVVAEQQPVSNGSVNKETDIGHRDTIDEFEDVSFLSSLDEEML